MNEEKELESYGIYQNYSKPDPDLYHDEDNVVNTLIQVKRNKSKNSEEWLVLKDKNVVLILPSKKFNNKEKIFLRTIDGVNFLINAYKKGNNSFTKIKGTLRDHFQRN